MSKKLRNFSLVAIFLLALVFRVSFVVTTPLPEFRDAATYSWPAWNLINGNGYSMDKHPPYTPTAHRGPTYPLFLSGIYLIFGRNYLVVQLIQALIGAITCILVYVIAKRFFDHKIAITSALIVAILPSLVYFTNHVITEVLFTFLLVILCYALMKAFETQKKSIFAIAGILLGISVLCRPEMLLFPLALFVGLFFIYKQRRKALLYFVVFLVSYIVTITPWTVRNYIVFQKLVPITTGGGILLHRVGNENYLESVKEIQLGPKWEVKVSEDKNFIKRGIVGVFKDPGYYVKGIFLRCFKLWKPASWSEVVHLTGSFRQYIAEGSLGKLAIKTFLLFLDGFTIAMGFLGIIVTFNNWKKYIVLQIFIFYPLVFYSLLWAIPRYRLPLMPFMIIFAVVGVFWCINKFVRKIKFLQEQYLTYLDILEI